MTEQNSPYFEYLLTPTSTHEEIFGTSSTHQLKQDDLEKIDGYLPTANISFLDDIFKINSSILNSLLVILSQKIHHDIPFTLIGSSTELPRVQEESSTLSDYFLIHYFIENQNQHRLSQFFNVKPIHRQHIIDKENRLTLQELKYIQKQAQTIIFSDEIQAIILEVWQRLQEEFIENRELFSDQRFSKLLQLMRISALTNERNEIDFSDIYLLKYCVSHFPKDEKKVFSLITKIIQNHTNKKNGFTFENFKLINVDDFMIDTQTEEYKESLEIAQTQFNLQGEGTKSSPFLITCVEDLMALNEPMIGTKGFYFKQTQDLNIKEKHITDIKNIGNMINTVTTPLSFDYDGDNHNITNEHHCCIFYHISKCLVRNLVLENTKFCKIMEYSYIINVHYKKYEKSYYNFNNLLDKAFYSKIENCSAHHLIFSHCKYSEIINCSAQNNLVNSYCERSKIINCSAENNLVNSYCEYSKIINCSVENNLVNSYCEHSKIINCSAQNNLVNSYCDFSKIIDCSAQKNLISDMLNSSILIRCSAKTIIANNESTNYHNFINECSSSHVFIYGTVRNCKITNCFYHLHLINGTTHNSIIINNHSLRISYSWMLGEVYNSIILYCSAKKQTLCYRAEKSKFYHCTVYYGESFIYHNINKCIISHCQIFLEKKFNEHEDMAGIVKLCTDSIIENCLVVPFKDGLINTHRSYMPYTGLVYNANNDTIIRHNVFTNLNTISRCRLKAYIVYEKDDSTTLTENYVYHNIYNDIILKSRNYYTYEKPRYYTDGRDGQFVDSDTVNQQFFENTLNWDFEKTWKWNEENKYPELQAYSDDLLVKYHDELQPYYDNILLKPQDELKINALETEPKAIYSELEQLLSENIWLNHIQLDINKS